MRSTGASSSVRRRPPADINKRTGEIRQMEVTTHSVDQRTSQHAGSRSRAQEFMRQRRRKNFVLAGIVLIIAAVLIFAVGSFAFRIFTSASMSLNDEGVSKELVAAEQGKPYYVLLAGLSDYQQPTEAASFVAILRIDEQSKTFSLMNIPNNISIAVGESKQDLLRNSVRYGGDAALVRTVKNLTEINFSHYVRITEAGLKKLVDDIGGVPVNVQYRVDDPRVGHVVVPAGEQTLNGDQAVAFVSATNFNNGRDQRTNNQLELFFSLLNKMTSADSIGWLKDSDGVASAIKTDFSYDSLSSLASLYSDKAGFYTATMPGSQYIFEGIICFSPNNSAWEATKKRFMDGSDLNTGTDTSGVDKSKLSIIVQNGSGSDGFAAQAAQKLEQRGYTIQETGNAESFVFDETLVVYKEHKDEAAAQAIVADLGVGRAVYASVYYSLKTDIQVMVGKDWKPIN